MKKIILSAVTLCSAFIGFAQIRVTNEMPVYTPPRHILVTFQRDYPDVVVSWEPVQALWRASYNKNNRIVNVYYYPNSQNYSVTLPSLSGYVPESIITKAIQLYGANLFDITRMKSKKGMDFFKVRLLEKNSLNTYRTVWLNGKDVEVTM
ncbi:MAG: hypothetical protein C4308_07620 [Chitinophagaceae bacterium]